MRPHLTDKLSCGSGGLPRKHLCFETFYVVQLSLLVSVTNWRLVKVLSHLKNLELAERFSRLCNHCASRSSEVQTRKFERWVCWGYASVFVAIATCTYSLASYIYRTLKLASVKALDINEISIFCRVFLQLKIYFRRLARCNCVIIVTMHNASG